MAKISPTAAILYTDGAGDPSDLLAPPYDVITEAAARRLRERSEHNAVRLVLPEGDAPRRYELAAARLADWLRTGILARAPNDSFYLYRQEFQHDGHRVARTALLAAVELSPFDRREVLPHETTHRGPKADRLALQSACRAQLSPIFFIARDPGRAFNGLLEQASGAPMTLQAQIGDEKHELRRVPRELQEIVLREAADADLLIADGHHRYETALELQRQHPDWPDAGAVLGAVVGEHDAGLVIRATHRRLTGLPEGWRARLEDWFHLEPVADGPVSIASALSRLPASTIGVVGAADHPSPLRALLRPRDAAILRSGLSAAEAGLACVLFDAFVLRALAGLADADATGSEALLSYHQDPAAAAADLSGDGAAFLLPPVRMESLWDVVRSGARLPPKSTFFAPKVPSGILFRPL